MTSSSVTAGAPAEASGPPQRPAPPLSPLRHPAIRGLLISEAVSSTGSQMTTLALPWFVLATTGSVSRMGLVFAAELLPVALLGIPAGLFVARTGVRRTMLLGDAIRAPLIALVPVLHAAGVLSFPLLLVMVALAGAVTTPYFAAQRLALPEIVGDDEQLVMRAGGLLEAAVRTAGLLGPALAGVMIGLLGATNVLWIDAATFAFSFAVLLPLPRPDTDLSAGAVSTGLWSGARAVLGDGLLATVSAASTLYGLFFPLVIASLPALAELRFGRDAHIAGALLAAWGGGALLGALTVGRLAGKLEPMRMGAAAALALDAALWFFPWHLPVVADGVILAAAGLFTPLLNTPLLTLLMTRTSPETRAQAVTFVLTANLLAGPLAFALSGVLFNAWGIERVLIVVAVGLFVCALLLGRLALPSDRATAAAAAVSSEQPG
jgi:predicted MFS family arabinose efflux permease